MHKINNPNINQNQNPTDTPYNTQYTKTKINPNERQTYTYSDSLQSMDKIREQLKGYERVDDIELVEIGTPVRYITWKYGKMRFCVGGLLVAKMPTYCKLTNYKKDIQINVVEQPTGEMLKKNIKKIQMIKRIYLKLYFISDALIHIKMKKKVVIKKIMKLI